MKSAVSRREVIERLRRPANAIAGMILGALIAAIVIPMLLMLIIGLFLLGEPDNVLRDDVQRLDSTLLLLERYQVTAFFNKDGCKKFIYERGRFSNNTPDCNWSDNKGKDFDRQAESDFEALAQGVVASGISLGWIEASYDASGRLFYASFDKQSYLGLTRYAYASQYSYLPTEVPNALTYKQIAEHWYLIEED